MYLLLLLTIVIVNQQLLTIVNIQLLIQLLTIVIQPVLDFSAILVFRMDEYIFNKRFGFSSLPDMGFPCTQKLKKLKPVWNFISANCHIGFSRVNIPGGNLTGRNHLEKKTGAFCRGNLPGIHPPRVLCVHYFLSNVYFSPSDSPSKTMKNIFYFI